MVKKPIGVSVVERLEDLVDLVVFGSIGAAQGAGIVESSQS